MDPGTNSLRTAIDGIFSGYGRPSPKKSEKGNVELELALAVLLVDLASCDQQFDADEYRTIAAGMQRVFGTAPNDVRKLVSQARLVLANLRGTSAFADLLREQLSVEERQAIMAVVDEVVAADGREDGFETYLRHKIGDLLGVPLAVQTGA